MNKSDCWVQVNSGAKWYLEDLSNNIYNIKDIANALSNLARYNGHADKFVSVAEHSYYVSQKVPKEFALEGLMHDAAEAVLSDFPRPIKYFLPGVKQFDEKFTEDIFKKYKLTYPFPDCIHEVDNRLLATEARQVMTRCNIDEWEIGNVEPYKDILIMGWRPEIAYNMFIERYQYLWYQRVKKEDEALDLIAENTGLDEYIWRG